jgi:hypothetical protein
MKRLPRLQQKKINFLHYGIGSATLPLNDYISSLSEYREDYYQEKNYPVAEDIDFDGAINYCDFRIDESNSADYGTSSYLASAYTLPDFKNQPTIHFGLSGDLYELQRREYFLKYYLYYKKGELQNWSAVSSIPYISGAPSAFENNISSYFDTDTSISSNNVSSTDVLEEFEHEYQEFINMLRQQRLERTGEV